MIIYMTTNFDFLKKVDKNLFEIISDAEKLYRDEYFEQCMTQTRRFGENVCKKVLGRNRTTENTFDDMLATLNDRSTGSIEEKEFINDLYYLKKHGNNAVHSSSVKKDGMEALECLKRAFEVAISYCVYYRGKSESILKLRYDTELLVTGQKSEKSLAEKYTEAKTKMNNETSEQKLNKQKTSTKPHKTTAKKLKKQSSVMVCKQPRKRISFYWIFTGISCVVAAVIILVLYISLHWK